MPSIQCFTTSIEGKILNLTISYSTILFHHFPYDDISVCIFAFRDVEAFM